MADNVLDSGPPSAKRPKLNSPALSVSASDGNDFGSLFDLEHDLPDELINSTELGLPNGGDLSQLHTSLGGGGVAMGAQDAAAKHKQLSELLRSGAPPTSGPQGAAGSPGASSMGLLGNMNASPGQQGLGQPPQQQQQPHPAPPPGGMMQQQGMVGVAGLNRGMMGAQKGNGPQQQAPTPPGLMGGQVMNGSPRMGYSNPGMGSNSNLLAETLQQQGGQQLDPAGQAGLRGQHPRALNKMGMMGNPGPYGAPYGQSAGQGLGGAGLGQQLQNKAGLPNSMAQFSLDKKTPAVQGMAGMVRRARLSACSCV